MELPKAYDHSQVEGNIYKLWEESGFFNPDNLPDAENREAFTIALPPPNVTGVLHMGHAFEDAIQDTVIRYQRMKGKRALWVPGTDHAAIATQAKFEKEHYKKQGKSRHDYSREEFFRMIQKFALENQQGILSQLHKLGLSLDWSRLAFTLDQNRELAVRTAFKRMYDAGLIYRGHRVVNWDPKGQTTVSDDEIEYEETKATLYTFRYSKDFPIAIATTRPETKLGDTAVAVNPEDARYQKYIGREFNLDFFGQQLTIKIIGDKEVDPNFGTGALGVTPAHSMTDYEIAQRHGLPLQQVINEYGKMTAGDTDILGKKTAEARMVIAEKLKDAGLMEKEEEIVQNLSKAQRTGGIIEPLPKLQWFVDVNKKFTLQNSKLKAIPSGTQTTLKEIMRQTVASGQIKIMPERFEKTYFHWIDNLRDWCISRQIIYGHRIPVWYKDDNIYCDTTPPQEAGWIQDTDTLDTWFSSGLWTFSTLGWPDNQSVDFDEKLVGLVKSKVKTKTYRLTKRYIIPGQIVKTHESQTETFFGFLKILSIIETTLGKIDWRQAGHEPYKNQADFFQTFRNYYPGKEISENTQAWIYEFEYIKRSDLDLYHPTSVMMPGYEILFFWVARMILMSGFLLGDIPFKEVYLHGIVRDKQGRKFSKSLNNGIDPLEMTAKYGTDALRFALVFGAAPGNDVIFDEQKVKGMKHFGNKLWNIARFIMTNLENYELGIMNEDPKPITEADKEILDALKFAVEEVTEGLNNFQLHAAAQEAYQFTWHSFADIYVEKSKAQLQDPALKKNTQAILHNSLLVILKLLHPFMPFITEHIWQMLDEKKLLKTGGLLMVAKWP